MICPVCERDVARIRECPCGYRGCDGCQVFHVNIAHPEPTLDDFGEPSEDDPCSDTEVQGHLDEVHGSRHR